MRKDKLVLALLDKTELIQKNVLEFLLSEPVFTGKITIDLNCNSGGITSIDLYTKRKLSNNIKLKKNM